MDWITYWSEQEVLRERRDISTRPQCGLKIQRQQEQVHRRGVHWQEGKSTDREQKVRPCGISIIIVQNINNNKSDIWKLVNLWNT